MNLQKYFSKNFANIERRIQLLVEGNLRKIFSDEKIDSTELYGSLQLALEQGCKNHVDGRILAPNLFIIEMHAHPDQKPCISEGQLTELKSSIAERASLSQWVFLDRLIIKKEVNEAIPFGSYRVKAEFFLEQITQTTTIETEMVAEVASMPENAYLIVNGVDIFHLQTTVINIGRRPDNHLVIDDARISRAHAQIRAIKGNYVIFDLGSTGGTYVNNQVIHQAVLFPGDVISLAGLPIIYNQDVHVRGGTERIRSESG